MKNCLKEERQVMTAYGKYCLTYQMHKIKEEGVDFFGISISQYRDTEIERNLCDRATILGFSEDLTETKMFFNILIQELVFPVHLFSIADDWRS